MAKEEEVSRFAIDTFQKSLFSSKLTYRRDLYCNYYQLVVPKSGYRKLSLTQPLSICLLLFTFSFSLISILKVIFFTPLSYCLPSDSKVSIAIFNIKGQRVATLLNEHLCAGQHSIIWNGIDENNTSVSTGLYLYRLETNDKVRTNKMLLLK